MESPAPKDRKKSFRQLFSRTSIRKAARLFQYIRPYRLTFTVGMVFLLLSSFSSMLFPALMGKLVDAGNPGSSGVSDNLDLSDINTVALLLLVVFFVQAVFSYFRIILFSRVTENMLADLRQSTYAHLIRLPMAFFNENRVGELNSRVSSDISILQETFTTTLAEFLRQLLIIGVGIALLAFYSIKLTLLMLGVVPVLAVGAVLFGKYIRRLSRSAQDEIAVSNTIVEETLSAIQSVKAYVNEQYEWLRYKGATNTVKDIALRNAHWRGLFAGFIIFGMFGAIVLVIWYGVHLKQAGELSMGDLFSFILYSVFVGSSFGGMANLFTQIQKSLGATEHLMELLDETEEDYQTGGVDLQQMGDILFNEVHFAYPSRPDMPALQNVSFLIPEGKRVALVGPSGAGKSTITQLLLKFYTNYEGHITVGDHELRDIQLQQLRGQMGIVPQEVLLFGGSIRDNIRYGNPQATDEEVRKAADAAYATEFIDRFPEGLDTVVGERGVQLSGGQRQRLAIARAILKNPALLILDEATSSLDSESEKWVQQALENVMKDRTSLIIAHRLSTVRHADLILVVKDGQVVEQGSHDDLIARTDSVYKELAEVQLA